MMLLWTTVEGTAVFLSRPYSLYQIIWTRYAAHLLFMLVVLGPRYKTRLVRTKHLGLQVFRGLLMLGMPAFFITAVSRLPVNDVMAAFWVAPLMVLALSAVVLRERIQLWQWAIAGAGLVGALFILRPAGGLLQWAIILPLGMAFCFSLYVVLTRYLRAEETITNLFYTALCVLAPLSLGMPFVWRTPTVGDILLMSIIGLLGLLLLYILDKACEMVPASDFATYLYFQPLWMVAANYLLAAELPGKLALLGALIISGSITLTFALNTG
jgi:drug/metabolite transporter (DMT)-like permease